MRRPVAWPALFAMLGAMPIASSAFVLACKGRAPSTTTDAGRDAASDDASDARSDAPVRVATTRGLLPTSVENLLLDPFVTADQSWGHFAAANPKTDKVCDVLNRTLMSQSPVGIAGVVVTASVKGGCTEILAPLSGASKGSVNAQVWISLSDATGAPLPFPMNDDELDASIQVALVPNFLPSQAPQVVYPLGAVSVSPVSPADGAALPLTIAGRQWGLVALSGAPLTQGGWLVISLVSTESSFLLAGPEVVPTLTVSLSRPHSRPMAEADRAAISSYQHSVRHHPPATP
jgi:hypothetical protein